MLDYTILDNGKAEFRVKKSLYQLKAIYRAAYLFMDDDYIGLDMDEEHFIIRFTGKDGQIDGDRVGRFQNELLNQCLKLAVSQDTQELRELIVTRALYSAFIPEGDTDESEEKEATAATAPTHQAVIAPILLEAIHPAAVN